MAVFERIDYQDHDKSLVRVAVRNLIGSIEVRRALSGGERAWKQVYFLHHRACAGTAITSAVSGAKDERDWREIDRGIFHTFQREGIVSVVGNRYRIRAGIFDFGDSSHLPLHQVQPPQGAKVFSVFREPTDRLWSEFNKSKDGHMRAKTLARRFECDPPAPRSFLEFCEGLSVKQLMPQLYCFSKEFDVSKALRSVSELDHVSIFPNFSALESFLSGAFGRTVEIRMLNASKASASAPPSAEVARVASMIGPELELWAAITQSASG